MGKEQFSSNVVVANEYTLLGSKSVYGTKTITSNTVTPVRVGVNTGSELLGRTTLLICNHPDNDLLYLGLDLNVSLSNFAFVLTGGQTVQLKIPSNDPIKFYMFSPSAGKVGIIEGAI